MPSDTPRDAVQVGDWIVDPTLDTISRGEETQKLEPRTMRLLMRLIDSNGAVVSQEKLLAEVWTGVIVGSASVYQAVSQLRKLLGDTDPQPAYIATIPRKGYRLVATVRRINFTAPVRDVAGTANPPPLLPAHAPSGVPEPAQSRLPVVPRRRFSYKAMAYGAAGLAIGAAVWIRWQHDATVPESPPSVVVLPFVDMTLQKTDQPFCDGLTEELSNWLAQIPTLRVVARTSAFLYKGRSEDVRQIGKALNTNHVIEGSMRRDGDRVRVTVQLIDARNGYHLWSADYDRKLDETIKIQEDISRSVAENLQIRLTQATEEKLLSRRSSNPEAYQLYLQAQHFQRQRTRESTEQAIAIYHQILMMDPKFALADVNLGLTLLNKGYFDHRETAAVAAEVEPLIAGALSIDPHLSEAYAVRGALRHDQYRISEALDDLRFAVSLNPNDSVSFAEMGRVLLGAGRPREALASLTQAAALNPLDFRLEQERCTAFTDLARYDEAAAACERARALGPESSLPLDELAWLAEARGRIDEALRWNAASIQAEPENFDRYWMRIDLLLAVGLPRGARDSLEQGRAATRDGDEADAAQARVVLRESGLDALRTHLAATQLDRSPHAISLLEAAYSRLMLGEPKAARELMARAVAAPDRVPGLDDAPWDARAGTSYRVDLAVADLDLGDHPAAAQELTRVRSMLDEMIAAGVQRHAVFELRAKVLALQGDANGAVRDLQKAAQLGWRRSWWAEKEPYFASLRPRTDYQAVIAKVNQSNEQLIQVIEIKSAP
jgi:TolB-like protein/DNA-binding winged helix-turn-helix (wHTH) protein/Tfp pilus assembly protein PilF